MQPLLIANTEQMQLAALKCSDLTRNRELLNLAREAELQR